MSLHKIGKYFNDRLPLFCGIGLIISIHWGWYKLQQIPYLVSESENKELPIIRAVKVFHSKLMDSIGSVPDDSPTDETTKNVK